MSRPARNHGLRPIGAFLGEHKGFPQGATHLEVVTRQLRTIVGRIRREKPRPFYGHREVAAFFRVPIRTAALAFKRLETEGLLSCVRGVGTDVPGLHPHARANILGAVAVPVWTEGFAIFADWRRFFIALEEELRKRGYLASFVFYQGPDYGTPELTKRILLHKPDIVVWLQPLPSVHHILHALADSGTRILAVLDPDQTAPFPQCRISWRNAMRRGLQDWRRKGIRRVLMPAWNTENPETNTWGVAMLRAGGLPFERISGAPGAPATLIQALGKDPDAGVFMDNSYVLQHLCHADWSRMSDLFRQRRVMITSSVPVDIANVSGLHADVLALDWVGMARQLAVDVARYVFPAPGAPTVFHAQYMPAAPLAAFCNIP